MPSTAQDGQRRGSKDDGSAAGGGAAAPAAGKVAPGKLTRTEQLPPQQAQPAPAAKPASIHDGAASDPLFRDGFVSTFVTPAGKPAASAAPAAPAASAAPFASAAPAAAKPDLAVKNLRLAELHAYTLKHPDWDRGTLDVDKAAVRQVLDFARRDRHLVLDGCGDYTVQSLVSHGFGNGATKDELIGAYSRAVCASRKDLGIRIYRPALAVVEAAKLGGAIIALEKALPFATLARAVPQTDSAHALEDLVAADAVEEFILYFKTASPLFDTQNGKDVESFLAFHEEGGLAKLAEYRAQLPHIRNYHHFTTEQLDALVAASAAAKANPQGKKLPVCAVLQCSTDSNGAFHRDPKLTALLKRETHLTLLAEGKKSLDAFSAALAQFATFGAGGKLDEILISGHGSAKKIELAGDEATGTVQQEKLTIDAADSDRDKQASARLFATIAQSLRHDADARVVLNACLTASHYVPTTQLPKPVGEAAAKLRELIAASPNLVAELQKKLGPAGQVIGANASFDSSAELVDPHTQRVAISSAHDPALTGSKLQYLQQGIEPQGVLRAFVETWSADPKAAIAAAKARCAAIAGESAWKTKVIYALLHVCCQHENDASLHVQLANSAGPLSALSSIDFCSVGALLQAKLPAAHREAIFTSLSAAAEWSAKPALAAVMLQGWSATQPSKVTELRKLLDGKARFTMGNRRYFEPQLLEPVLPLFLDGKPASPAPFSDLFIAMLFLVERGAQAPKLAKDYVKAVAAANGGTLPARLYGELLVGVDLATVLRNAGAAAPAAAAATAAAGADKPPPAAGAGAGAKDRKDKA